jgi:hypothetical protein
LPHPFTTQDLAENMGIDVWLARQVAYCLRQIGAIRQVGRQGNWLLYQ